MVKLNKVWGVVVRGDSFILQKNGRDFRAYGSVRELWENGRDLFGKVDDTAINRLFILRKVDPAIIQDPEIIPVKLGLWLHPEQLPKRKERHVGDKRI
ncbi:hypothetical protein FJ941_09645 [Mesorhizobium sp. B2-3-13]|uniref:hypothetical protein n=1 Tax=Mesorhizobium sp. B2-3-13 TaxID=2589951 RepID=UPI00112DDBF0|nr:hypothetical protein [Mesorhizobium sp. B2-3-13]TPL84493.1 hypothetical protein FJ941_09645 [Mesorhizobium sp. B2-3-13]